MGVLADWQIAEQVKITPFEPGMKRPGIVSYGLSSYGYDLRTGYKFKVFTNVHGAVVDPKNFDPRSFVEVNLTDHVLIPPNSFCLAESFEHLEIPRDCMGIVIGKSTYARCGIVVNVTPLEPEWRGHITIEISNTTPLPAKIYAGEGIAQVYFLRTDGLTWAMRELLLNLIAGAEPTSLRNQAVDLLERCACRTSYTDKGGRYQDQKGLTLPCVDGAPK